MGPLCVCGVCGAKTPLFVAAVGHGIHTMLRVARLLSWQFVLAALQPATIGVTRSLGIAMLGVLPPSYQRQFPQLQLRSTWVRRSPLHMQPSSGPRPARRLNSRSLPRSWAFVIVVAQASGSGLCSERLLRERCVRAGAGQHSCNVLFGGGLRRKCGLLSNRFSESMERATSPQCSSLAACGKLDPACPLKVSLVGFGRMRRRS